MTPVHCHRELWAETALQGTIQNLPLPLFDQNCFNLILRRLQCNTSACQDKTDQLGFFFFSAKLAFYRDRNTEGPIPFCSPVRGSVPRPPAWGFQPGNTTPLWWVCTRYPLCTDLAQFHPGPKGRGEKKAHALKSHMFSFGASTRKKGNI